MKGTDAKTLTRMVSLTLKRKRYFLIRASRLRQTQGIAKRNPAGSHTVGRLKAES